MPETKIYDTIIKMEPIEKGWSEDKKYCVTVKDGTKYLLRISPTKRYEHRKSLFEMMKQVDALGIPMCRPVEFGICSDGVYSLQTWIDGEDLEAALPLLSETEQYVLGLQAGEILRKIHSVPAPATQEDWTVRFNRKIDWKIEKHFECGVHIKGEKYVLDYIEKNRHLLQNRPQCFQHGDYHIGNMMIENGKLQIIDFDRYDFGDPWEEFNRISWSAQKSPHFATGQLRGYFDGSEPPPEFFKLLALYVSCNMMASVWWAQPFGDDEVNTMLNQAKDILCWFDNMNTPVPSWYLKEYNNQYVSVIQHYDTYIDEINDPSQWKVIDPAHYPEPLREYMNKWDGAAFIEALQLTPNKSVMEIGVGTGRLALRVCGNCDSITGIDISAKTIEHARKNLREFKNIRLICADFLAYAFSETFDIIYSSLTFMHIKNKLSAIQKVEKLLHSGGRFILSIDKNQQREIDFSNRKIKVYPDIPEEIASFITEAGLTIENQIETEFAYILVAKKEKLKPIYCPNCGILSSNDVLIYNEGLRKQNLSISPILPFCKHCAAEVSITHKCNGGRVIILNGTSGSGKSTIAEILFKKGFLAIDGDCAIQAVRHKKGTKQYEWSELINEIACEIDTLSLFGKSIVISHVVLPEDMNKYIDIFESRNLKYNFFLLRPEYQTAVDRCQARTCHSSVTPEYWIKHFYDLLNFDERVVVLDNTNMTAEETAEWILENGGLHEAIER